MPSETNEESSNGSSAPTKASRSSRSSSEAPQGAVGSASDTAKTRRRTIPVPQHQKYLSKRVGKADLKRDMLIFFTAIAFLFLIAWSTKDVGKPRNAQSDLKQAREALAEKMRQKLEKEKQRKRKIDCDLFLARSSVPGAGFGVFAGRQYAKGELVIDSGLFYPLTREPIDQGGEVLVSQMGLLLKHHPFLGNLVGGRAWLMSPLSLDTTETELYEGIPFKASREISPGEELFLNYDSHPHQIFGTTALFSNIPRLADYQMANEIVRDEIQDQIVKSVSVKGNAVAIANSALRTAKKAVAKVNKKVAALLPSLKSELTEMYARESDVAFASMRNWTVSRLEVDGHCIDDVELKRSPRDSGQVRVVAKRPIKKGATVVTVPLYAVATRGQSCASRDEQTCAIDVGSKCFGGAESSVALCPLSAAAFLRPSSSEAVDALQDVWSAEYQWSSWNTAVEKAHGLTVESLLKDYGLSLSFDLVALRDITPGEEIFADLHKPYKLFPEAWRESVSEERMA